MSSGLNSRNVARNVFFIIDVLQNSYISDLGLVRNRSPRVKYPYNDFLYIRGPQSIYHTSYRNMYSKVHNINRYNLYIRKIIYMYYIPGTTSNINYCQVNFLIHIVGYFNSSYYRYMLGLLK